MDHLKTESIIEYITDKMSEGDSFRLETHLADCDECAEKVYRLNHIRENFDEVWDSLSAENLARDLFEIRLLESLVKANLKQETLKRVQSWVDNFFQKTHIVIGIAVDKSKKSVRILQDAIEEMRALGQIPSYVPVGEPVRVLGEGTEEETRHEERQGPNGEKIDIYYEAGKVQLKIIPLSFESPLPLLWLLPEKDGPSIIKETRRPRETDYLVAEFSIEELADLNDYVIFLEYK